MQFFFPISKDEMPRDQENSFIFSFQKNSRNKIDLVDDITTICRKEKKLFWLIILFLSKIFRKLLIATFFVSKLF
jgi:hypothetical protein